MNAPNMPRLSILFGVLLIIQGLVFWGLAGFEMARFTAAIPAFFGILIGGFGLVAALAPAVRKHVMHLNVLLAVVGVAGGISMFFKGLRSDEPAVTKLVDQGLLAAICFVFVVFCVRSFITARASRADATS